MRQFIIAVVVVGCAGGQQGVDARAERPPRAERSAVAVAEKTEATGEHEGNVPFTSAPRFSEADQSDQAFIVNARRAIAEYQAFIEKAGDASEYAEAVARSRERIADLEQMIVFFGQGRSARDSQ